MRWTDAVAASALALSVHAISIHEQIPLDAALIQRPNIVFILTDDQDVHLDSLKFMPFVQKHLLSQGGYPKFVTQGFNENYLPVWLQEAGYNTYYTGKLFNVHSVENYNSPYPAGFNGTDFLLDPYTYNYMNSTFQRDHEAPRSYEGEYVTDVIAQKAYRLLDEAIRAREQPFFLTIAPSAPHVNIEMNGNPFDDDFEVIFSAPIAAERHQDLFSDEKVPRAKNFNPDLPSGANWVLQLPKQSQENIDYNDHLYRQRLRALQAVDELVDGLFQRLESHDLLKDTYVMYSSDNGYHIGQHRLQPGKSCGYEEDVNIPLIIRGPGVATNVSTDIVTTHTDLAPTFLELLGIRLRDDLDGRPIPVKRHDLQKIRRERQEHANVEYWGFAGGEGKYDDTLHQNNTYKAIRLFASSFNLYYSIWCNNEHELYNMDVDPGQLHNLLSEARQLGPSPSIAGHSIHKIVSRLDALLLVLKSCKGQVCREPWKTLHPEGSVWCLEDALDSRFDHFYEIEQTRVVYDHCENGYVIEAEGPMWESHGKLYERHGLSWDTWI